MIGVLAGEEELIRALGSWEPLPTGSALVDYWRNRLGKAERLILETLTHAYPVGLNRKRSLRGPATKPTAVVSTTPSAG
jgi:hypothetical protein